MSGEERDRSIPVVTEDEGTKVVTFDNVSVDDYSPVRVVIRVAGNSARVRVTCLPGGSWWRCPGATLMRRMVDTALADTGKVRDGARMDTGTPSWSYLYTLKDRDRSIPDTEVQ